MRGLVVGAVPVQHRRRHAMTFNGAHIVLKTSGVEFVNEASLRIGLVKNRSANARQLDDLIQHLPHEIDPVPPFRKPLLQSENPLWKLIVGLLDGLDLGFQFDLQPADQNVRQILSIRNAGMQASDDLTQSLQIHSE